MPKIIPKKVYFSPVVQERMWKYVENQVDWLIMEAQGFNDNVLPEWTRLLKGIPKETDKSFPFPGCANLVVQLIATRVEQLLSRVMMIYEVDPLWTIGATGDLPGQEADEQAKVLEQFMVDMAIDPEELNLYRKEEIFFHDGIAYGTSFMALPLQYLEEHQSVIMPGQELFGVDRESEFKTFIKKDGPSPENIPLHRILISNKNSDLESARFFAREVPLTREQVEDRIAFGIWPKETGEKVLANPDNYSGSTMRTMLDLNKGINSYGNEQDAEYRIYECHFKFVHDKKTFSIVAHYHRGSHSHLSAVFNWLPKNMLPFEDLRFGYDSDQYRGYGFIEMLQSYQKEMSTIHNNRLDNEAIRNNVTFRINKDSELASTLKWYPGVTVQADENEVEVLQTQGIALDNLSSEQATVSITNERSGIDPAIAGAGGGIVNQKRGIYSSQGTLAVLQQQNNRTGLRMMDVRGVHTRIGRKLVDLYGFTGAGKRLARYGAQADLLRKALDNVRAEKLGLLLKASSASTNIEQDRQNSILLQGLQEKYVAIVNQILQGLQQAQNDEGQVKYLQDVLFAQQALARHIFRVFGHYDVDKLVPFPEFIKNARAQQEQQSQQFGGGLQPQQVSGIVPGSNALLTSAVPSSRPQ